MVGALKKILPIIGAAIAMRQNAGGAFAQTWQDVDKERQAQASQKAAEDLKLATVIHQQEMEKAAQRRQIDLDRRQAATDARMRAAQDRQKALDTYTFLNKQAENPNWTQGVLELANSDPKNVDKLAIKTPWGESLPLSKVVELGFISQDKDGKFVHKTKKPPVHKKFIDGNSMWDLMLDAETGQEVTRTYLGEKADKPDSVVPQDRWNEEKQMFMPGYFDKDKKAWFPETNANVGAIHSPPGQAQRARQQDEAGAVSKDIASALNQINDVERNLGPIAGRVYFDYLMGKVGSTGDQRKDAQLGALRNRINTIKDRAPVALTGTTRAGGATGLIARFDKVMSTNMTASGLRGALRDLKESIDDLAGTKATPENIDSVYTRDANGRLVMQGGK